MRELPSGTVTFLFTDIEGSTRLLQALGDSYAECLAEHRRVLREAFGRHGGVEVDTQGDAFFVSFAKASAALAAAREMQASLRNGPVRVRIGLHTGEPIVTEEGYVGMDVHRAARIAGAGHGGQILVSQATRELAGVDGMRDLGEHRLKDLLAPERIYQLGDEDFPPLKALYRSNLPVVATAFVGRKRELGEAEALLGRNRLLTLTGPGGSGKTRLAMQLAAATAEEFPDGVFWVPLQAVRDPSIVERTIAGAVGADDQVVEFVGNKRVLLLLDNFEHIVEAASTVAALLGGTSSAKVLITSREPLQVAGEQIYPVEPLRSDEATKLFEERASAVLPEFRLTPEVGAICERLDRLPLAIELAAARVVLLDPVGLLARLEERLPLLTSRSRDAPARQKTLRATIDWSYELLDPEERRLLRRLSVFRGSFSLEAALDICESHFDLVESLVVKSLLRRRFETQRLLMLDTIREYAQDRLEATEERDSLRRRHADYFLDVSEAANLNAGDLHPGGQRLEVAHEEQDNIRGAIAWCVRVGEVELGLKLANAFEQFWVTSDPAEGVRWYERLLPAADDADPLTRAHALRSYGGSLHIAGDTAAAEQAWKESLAAFAQQDDEHGCAVLEHRLAISAMIRGDTAAAWRLVRSSHQLHSRADDPWRRDWGHAQTTGTMGALARDAGDDEKALEAFQRSAELAEEVGVRWWRAGMIGELAALSLRQRDIAAAETYAGEALALHDSLGDRAGRVFGVGVHAAIAAQRGEAERAGRLWGAIEDQRALAPLGGWERHRDDCEACIQQVAGPSFDAGRTAGRQLELADAVGEALAKTP